MRTLLYLDTNIILARYAPDEPQHEEAKNLLVKIEEGKLASVTSILTLIEVVSTTSRAYNRFKGKPESMKREEGAGAFLRSSPEAAAELRRRVTSPNGTTEAAFKRIEEGRVRATLVGAVRRAAERSRELARS